MHFLVSSENPENTKHMKTLIKSLVNDVLGAQMIDLK
jgi:hypothetical protein